MEAVEVVVKVVVVAVMVCVRRDVGVGRMEMGCVVWQLFYLGPLGAGAGGTVCFWERGCVAGLLYTILIAVVLFTSWGFRSIAVVVFHVGE